MDATGGLFGAGTGVEALDLPPLLREINLRESGDAFAHARANAAKEGAGTLIRVRRFDVAEFAVVLEPEEPLATARRILYLGLLAMADALASIAPPEKPILFDWPDTIRLDGAIVGGGRIAWPEGAAEDRPPDWLVFGGMIRVAEPHDAAGGLFARGSTLEVEGADIVDPAVLIEGFARHLLLHIDRWREKGFRAIGADWLAKLAPEAETRRGIDGNGDLLIHRAGGGPAERRPLLPVLAAPAWRDPETGMPWL